MGLGGGRAKRQMEKTKSEKGGNGAQKTAEGGNELNNELNF